MATSKVAEVSSITTALDEITLEEIGVRHRKERKELQAKIQAMKKNAPKSDKKKRKEVLEEIASLENNLEQRQAQELNNINGTISQKQTENNIVESKSRSNEELKQEPQLRVSKAQKRRDKKSREAKQREEEIRAFEEECRDEPKSMELNTITDMLKERQLMLHHIPSDGDCLYNAVRSQINTNLGLDYTINQLREETANYIAANKNSLICYMTNPQSGELLNDSEFESYCENVRSSHAWGGQIELKALSSILKAPIEVLQATGVPTVQGEDEYPGPNLVITYHRHMYSLGEHYNATKPLKNEAVDNNLLE